MLKITCNIQIQPGLKAKLCLIILINNKKINRVMLNRDSNESFIKINRSNQQKKNKFARAAHFFLSSKKQICACSMLFCLYLLLFCITTMLFWTTKMSNFFTHFFLWRNCRICLPKILFPVFMFAFIFSLLLIFTQPLAFLIFSLPL